MGLVPCFKSEKSLAPNAQLTECLYVDMGTRYYNTYQKYKVLNYFGT